MMHQLKINLALINHKQTNKLRSNQCFSITTIQIKPAADIADLTYRDKFNASSDLVSSSLF